MANATDIEACTQYNTKKIANSSDAIQYLYSDAETLVHAFALPIILFFGVSCNSAFLFVVAKIKRLRTITNYYLVSIAIADITLISVSVGNYLWVFFSSGKVRENVPWEYSTGCVMGFTVSFTTYFTSLALITLVTLERYYAICIPLRHRAVTGKRRTVKIIVTATLISAILGGLVTLRYAKLEITCFIWPTDDEQFTDLPSITKTCVTLHDDVYIMSEVLQTVPFFVAMLWNGYMYVKIIYTLNNRNATKIASQMQTQAIGVRNQVARLLILNGSVFFFCQVVYRLVAVDLIMKQLIDKGIFSSNAISELFVIIGRGLLFLNSSINPILYNLSSSFYYDAFKEAFASKCTHAAVKNTKSANK